MQLDSRLSAPSRLACLGLAAVAIAALGACASKPLASTGPAPVTTATPVPAGGSMSGATTLGGASAGNASALPATGATGALDPNSAVARQRSVYFTFDSNTFRPQDKPVVELHGQYLVQHPETRVIVAGNTDERGGSEYNLALGQRRAESVKSALALLGVKDGQVEATSYGKEKPQATGHDEAAWQQNRRADFVYPAR